MGQGNNFINKQPGVLVFLVFFLLAPGKSALCGELRDFDDSLKGSWSSREGRETDDEFFWIGQLKDERLNALIQEALENNHDLQTALARLRAVRAKVLSVKAKLKPALTFRAGMQNYIRLEHERSNEFIGAVSFDWEWDTDLGGLLDSQLQQDTQKEEALKAKMAFVKRSLVRELVKNWFLAIEAEKQKQLAALSVNSYEKIKRIVLNKFEQGIIPKQEIHLAQADLARAQEVYIQTKAAHKEILFVLEVLAGRYPDGTIEVSKKLPEVSSGGLLKDRSFAELIQRREDLQSTRHLYQAASKKVEYAQKLRNPKMDVTASFTRFDPELNILDEEGWFFHYGANMTVPLVDNGYRHAQILASLQERRETLLNHQSLSLEAFHELELALANAQFLEERKEALMLALEESKNALDLAHKQYESGTVDLVTISYFMLKVHEARTRLLHLKVAQLRQRVDLYYLLGEKNYD